MTAALLATTLGQVVLELGHGLYSFWKPGSIEIQTAGQEVEVYDYRTRRGRMELENVAMANGRLYNRL